MTKRNELNTIFEGAEAKIMQINENTLKKLRIPKQYRLEQIDKKLRKFRCKREFKVLTKLHEMGINVPKPLELELETEISFTLEYIKGKILKTCLTKESLFDSFEEIIKMHNSNIVHQDLTTLNMIQKDKKIYIIDFGLADFSNKIEDKAVDLNLFFLCIKNEHPQLFDQKEKLIDVYTKKTNKGNKIIQRLKEIEKRGRNK